MSVIGFKRGYNGVLMRSKDVYKRQGYAWTNGGQGVLAAIGTDKTFDKKTGSNGCPDVYKRQAHHRAPRRG